jgi:GTP-binding protein
LDFAQINSELALFDPDLARKPQVVALNKMDLPDVQARWPQVAAQLKRRIQVQDQSINVDEEPMAVSAVAGTGLRLLLYRAAQLLKELPPPPTAAELPVYRPEDDPRQFTITHASDGWHVSGKAIQRAAEMTYWEHYQSVRRFQRILEALGVDQALRRAGIQSGDTVFIGEFELEWQD